MTALLIQPQLSSGNQIDSDVVFQDGDVWLPTNQAGQGVLHRQAGGVSDVDHATRAVTALAGKVVTTFVTGEGNALFNEPVDRAPTVLDDKACGACVIEKSTSGDRVADMGLDRVAVV